VDGAVVGVGRLHIGDVDLWILEDWWAPARPSAGQRRGKSTETNAAAMREHFIDETPPGEPDEDALAGPYDNPIVQPDRKIPNEDPITTIDRG
jgi:hypothetical protein